VFVTNICQRGWSLPEWNILGAKLFTLPTNMRLGCKWPAVTNIQARVAYAKKLFTAVIVTVP